MIARHTTLPSPETITRTVLDNGIVVLVHENFAAQSVVLTGSFLGGSIYETPEKSGLAAITAAGVMRGTHQHDFDTIYEQLERIGANLSVNGGVHRASFYGKSLAEDLSTLLELLSDVLRQPSFPVGQIERLRGEVLTGLRIRQQDTRYQAGRLFRENLYAPEHLYHHSASGTLETVPAITLDDIAAFHQKHYGPQGLLLVIVGAVDTAAALDIVRAHLGDWHNPNQPPLPLLADILPRNDITRATISLPGKTQSDLVMGVVGPSRFAPDFRAASLANSVLGQFGMMGRIGHQVREKLGLAYYASSRVDGGPGPAPWSISAGVNPANVELAVERIVEEVRRFTSEWVSEDELADNQAYFTGHLPLQLESNEGIAGMLLSMETFNLGLDYLVNYRDEIYRVTREDLLQAARRYWNPDAYVLAIAQPE
jgi:zinc protease